MELLNNYNKALESIYEHVGFTEDWVVFPINDNTHHYWNIDGEIVNYADSIEELESGEGNCYIGSIYRQSFYEKHVYEGKDITLIFLDTHTDGMKYFSIFDNNKKVQ